jgi:hypothetical protein
MRDYTKIEAWKLADDLTVLKAVAVITSAIVLGLARILPASFGP